MSIAEHERQELAEAVQIDPHGIEQTERQENLVTSEAPRAFNREMYHDHPENVFYGTDDGAQDGSFSEFAEIKSHYEIGRAHV